MRVLAVLAVLCGFGAPVRAADRYFKTSDGVRLHYIEAGHGPHIIVMVPGWTMPAWIFNHQIGYFSKRYHVVALDPRGQGQSQVARGGYNQDRRGQDIGDLIAHVAPAGRQVLLMAWSLGVLDSLAYVHQAGPGRLAGLVLVDNSVGENPRPVVVPESRPALPRPWDVEMRQFVRSMFARDPGQAYLNRLTKATLVTPEWAAKALLAYPVPRSYWRETLYTVPAPILYVVRPRFQAQAANVVMNDPKAETVLFTGAGHALFVDQADRFNQVMQNFISSRIWP
jgi:microsomal epoxide hydrolase